MSKTKIWQTKTVVEYRSWFLSQIQGPLKAAQEEVKKTRIDYSFGSDIYVIDVLLNNKGQNQIWH